MKIDLHVDTDDLPDDVIVIERAQGRPGWVIRRRSQRPNQPPDVYARLGGAIEFVGQRPTGPCTLIVLEFNKKGT